MANINEHQQKYISGFDELNTLTGEWLDTPLAQARESFEDLLIEMYLCGFDSAIADIGLYVEPKIHDFMAKSYEGETISDKLAKYLETGDKAALNTLVETEYHNAFNEGVSDYAKATGSKKTWQTVGDDKVRQTHEELESVSVGADEYFYTSDGDRALYPGNFTSAANNVNCRCWIQLK